MKVAIIPSADLSYNSGSVIYAKNLYKFLFDKKHTPYLLGSKLPNDLTEKYLDNIIIKNKILEHPIIDDRQISNHEYADMLHTIIEFILEVHKLCGGLDIIHAHYASINSYAAVTAGILIDVPVIVSSFGRDLNIGFKKDKRTKKMIISSLNMASGVIAVDTNIKKNIQTIANISENKMNIIGMPIDTSIVEKYTPIVTEKDKIVLTSINSCFSEEKGIEKIITAFEKINKQYSNTVLYLAGTDDHPQKIHEKKIIKLIQEKNLKNKVKLTGFLSRTSIGSLLKDSDIYIDARDNSNFSSVLLEAMLIGVPIIASENEGSKKIIINNYNGILFNKNSINNLVGCIEELIKNKEKRYTIVSNGNKWIKTKGAEYLPDKCFDEVLKFYKKIKEDYIND